MTTGDAAAAGGAAIAPPQAEGWRWHGPLDPVRLVYAGNIALMSVLSLFVAFLLNLDHSYWSLITIPFVAQMGSGVTVWRSVMRIVGTVIGGVVGIAIVALFAQSPAASIAAMALWAFAVGVLARFEIGFDAYAYGTAGLTALLIAFDTGANADIAFGLAVTRVTETLIPVAAAFAILLVLFPQSVAGVLRGGLREARGKVLALVGQAARPGAPPSAAHRQAATKALAGVHANLRALRFERSHRGPAVSRFAAAANRLNHLLIAAETLSLALEAAPTGLGADRALGTLRERLDALPERPGDPEAAAAAAAGFRAFVAALDADAETRVAHGTPEGDEAVAAAVVPLYAIRRLATELAAFLEAEAAVFDPKRPSPLPPPIASRYPDRRAAVERGLRPALLLVVLSAVWIGTASPSLQAAVLLSSAMSLSLPTIAPRASLTSGGLFIGLGIAAMFLPVLVLLAALPYVESFAAFALILGAVMFAMFYVCSAPGLLTYALGGTIFLGIGLQPANTQTYDALALFNGGAALALLPVSIAVAFTVVMPENQPWLARHLQRGMRHLLARAAKGRDRRADEFLAQSLDVIADYGGDLDLADPTHRRLLARSRVAVSAGTELYALHDLSRHGHLPPALAARVAQLGAAVLAAAEDRWDGTSPGVFAAAAAQARDLAADAEAPGPTRAAALRFMIGARFLGSLVANDRLSPGGATDAA